MSPFGCVTGRFQPIHEQHLELFDIALTECKHLIVAVTNPDTGARHEEPTSNHRHTDSANPFTYFERVQLIQAVIQHRGLTECVTIVPFNLTRADLWPQYVPLSARQFVRAFSEWERQKALWLEQAGYALTLLDGDPSTRLSSSDIRASMRAGDDRWRRLVSAVIVPLLDDLLSRQESEEQI